MTLAGSVVMVASVLVIATVWEQVSGLRSLETREAIEDFLAEPPGNGMGLDVEGVIGLLHVAGLVAAACACAAAVLGWFVMRRDKTARLALAVVAVPLFVTGFVAGGFASSFIAAAAAMLWLSPAREWFATGRWTPPQPRQASTPESRDRTWPPPQPPAQPPHDPSAGPSADPSAGPAGPAAPPPSPRPYASPQQGQPWGQQPDHQTQPQGQPAQPYAAPWPPHAHQPVRPHHRPPAVVTAVVIATAMAALVALVAVLAVIVVGMSPELVMDEVERQRPDIVGDGLTMAQLKASTYVSGGVCLALCALALTFAGFTTVGRDWARRGLMITAAFSAGACFLVSLSAPVALVPAAAAVATVVLLGRPEARAWCRARPRAERR